MAWIPDDAEWYLADIVLRIRVQGEARIVVHINTMLIHASSPDEAYAKAMALGDAENMSYLNTAGRRVTFKFVGLRSLSVVYEKLEDGAELVYTQRIVRSVGASRRLVRKRAELGVFQPIRRNPGPDYTSAQVVREIEAALGRPIAEPAKPKRMRSKK